MLGRYIRLACVRDAANSPTTKLHCRVWADSYRLRGMGTSAMNHVIGRREGQNTTIRTEIWKIKLKKLEREAENETIEKKNQNQEIL